MQMYFSDLKVDEFYSIKARCINSNDRGADGYSWNNCAIDIGIMSYYCALADLVLYFFCTGCLISIEAGHFTYFIGRFDVINSCLVIWL